MRDGEDSMSGLFLRGKDIFRYPPRETLPGLIDSLTSPKERGKQSTVVRSDENQF